jgi:hypothetical protein
MVGEAGNAILFVSCLAGTAMFGGYAVAYSAHCLLVVMQETAAGQDEIRWPGEALLDWVFQTFPVLAVLALWLVPAGIAARSLRETWLPDDPGLRFILLAAPGLWLFFPIGLLSALSADSAGVPLRFVVLWRLLRVAPSTFAFYLATAIVLAIGVAPWYYTLFAGRPLLLPISAVVTSAAILVYARLLGRLAWLIGRLPSGRDEEEEEPRPEKSGSPPRRKKRKPRPQVEDPWGEPPPLSSAPDPTPAPAPRKKRNPHAPPLPDEIEAYGFADDPPSPPAPARSASSETSEVTETPPPPRPSSPSLPPPSVEVEERFLERPPEYIPSLPLLEGVYTFPLYMQSLQALIWLSAAWLIVGLGGIGMVKFWPY